MGKAHLCPRQGARGCVRTGFLRRFVVTAAVMALTGCAATPAGEEESRWIALFNGKDLKGWTPKIRGYELGEDPHRTFRVEEGLLKVRYDEGYEQFNDRFGHLFYEKPFSRYILRAEYRFVGEQVPGGAGWAYRNSGLMLHGQDPKTMGRDQNFPVSIEVQLLGGDGTNERTTANLCTPGTHVVMDGKLVTQHCISSTSKTYHGDQWVTVEVEVHGGQIIRHIIDGEVVLEYNRPVLDPNDADAQRLIQGDDVSLSGGTISVQSESHPIDFRRIELLVLDE